MTSHRRTRYTAVAAIVASLCLAPAASAMPVRDSHADYPRPVYVPDGGDTPSDYAQHVLPAPKAGDTQADFGQPAGAAPKSGDTQADFGQSTGPAPKSGDTQADFGQSTGPAPKSGDTQIDGPGASGSPVAAPVDAASSEGVAIPDSGSALTTVLIGLALVAALGGGLVAVGRHGAWRTLAGRLH